MVEEVLKYLCIGEARLVVDLTFGGGGHTRAMLEMNNQVRVIGCDWDAKDPYSISRQYKNKYGPRFDFVATSMSTANDCICEQSEGAITGGADGVLIDVGVSSMQLDEVENSRGFSIKTNAPLDMRMDGDPSRITAHHIINTYPANKLSRLLSHYGDEPLAKEIADAVVYLRPISGTNQLAKLVAKVYSHFSHNVNQVDSNTGKASKKFKTHPATKTFMALRIAVNNEHIELYNGLLQGLVLLKPLGRLVVIVFTPTEAKIVQRFIQLGLDANILSHPYAQWIPVSPTESSTNPRARSARLTYIVKV